MKQHNEIEGINILEALKVIRLYKWSIIGMGLLFLGATYLILSIKQPTYSSYAIVKIKNSDKKNLSLSSYIDIKKINIKEDIALLKTFYINDKVLNKINYTVQYFINGKEIYHQIPIHVDHIERLESNFLGKKVTLIPQKDGYKLKISYPALTQLKSIITGTPLPQINNRLFPYKKSITTKYFTIKIDKLSNFKEPIEIKINGDHRYVYENIIKKNLHITQVDTDVPLIKISYNDTLQERATNYINTLTETFIEESIQTKSEQHNKILQFITHKLDAMKEELDKSERELETYRVSNEVIQPSEQAKVLITELSKIDISLSENQLKVSLVNNIMKFIKGSYHLDAIAPSLMELNDQPTLELISLLQKTQLKKKDLLSELTPKHPTIITLNQKIETLKRKIISNIKGLQRHIAQKSKNLKSLKKTYEAKLKKLPTKERELINIKRSYKVSSKIYNFLLEKQAENEIAKVATLSNYKVIDKAYGNFKPIGVSQKNILIAFTFLGIILGIILAFIRNALNNKIRDKSDIEKLTSVPIYGTIPFAKDQEPRVEVYHNPNTPFAESYRVLRTNLQLEMDPFQILLISSTIHNEGKNITTANLGAIFDMANYKTIVIDLDLRTPTLHKLFELKPISKGITHYLQGDASLSEIIHHLPKHSLHLIPVGKIPTNPSDLILSSRLPELLNLLKDRYDYIIINSAPLGRATDTRHIMQFSDINLILVREGYTQKSYVSNLNRLAQQKKFKEIGIVFISDERSYELL